MNKQINEYEYYTVEKEQGKYGDDLVNVQS